MFPRRHRCFQQHVLRYAAWRICSSQLGIKPTRRENTGVKTVTLKVSRRHDPYELTGTDPAVPRTDSTSKLGRCAPPSERVARRVPHTRTLHENIMPDWRQKLHLRHLEGDHHTNGRVSNCYMSDDVDCSRSSRTLRLHWATGRAVRPVVAQTICRMSVPESPRDFSPLRVLHLNIANEG